MADKKTSPKTLVEALCEFQKHHHAAGLDGDNPFFKSKYTTLPQALSAIQPATEYGLCHSQLNEYEILPDGQILTIVVTKLMHVSGDEPIVSRFPVPKLPSNPKNVHQEAGSAQTYARRYGLLSVYGLANDDDDGNSLMNKPEPKKGVGNTRTKPNEKLEPTAVLKKLPEPISKEAREAILEQLSTLQQLHPDKMKAVIEAFKDKFNIKSSKISGHITTAEHGEFLALEISKIDESL